jgi:hypothetical protein
MSGKLFETIIHWKIGFQQPNLEILQAKNAPKIIGSVFGLSEKPS